MKKSVAILINGLSGGGAERMVSRISYPLSEQYELYIFTLYVSKNDYECNGHVIDLGRSGNYCQRVWNCITSLNAMIKQYQISCIVSFLQVPDLVNILFNHSCKRVINLRGFQSFHTTANISNCLKYILCKLFYRFADGMIAVSKELMQDGIQRFHIPPNRCFAIENFVEEEEIVSESEDKQIINFLHTHKTVAAVGRLVWTKNYEELLQIIALVKRDIPNVGILILGEGNIRSKLEKLIENLGIKENVLLAGSKKSPMCYVKQCKMYVSLSFFEGFPNALLEGMMCEIPVLHTACKTGPIEMLSGGFSGSEQIDHPVFEKYGILVPDCQNIHSKEKQIENRKEIAEIICKVLMDEKLQVEYGKRAKQRAKQYSKECCIEKYIQVIEKITE